MLQRQRPLQYRASRLCRRQKNFFRSRGHAGRFTESALTKSRSGTFADSPYYYICVPDSGHGFVIVAGNDAMPDIVGYSFESSADSIPSPLMAYLEAYSSFAADASAGEVGKSKQRSADEEPDIEAVAPLLTTSWGQDEPYNRQCPELVGTRTPAGCVATAVAQIMKYYRWPERGTGSTEDGTDFSAHVYDWNGMKDSYGRREGESGFLVPDYTDAQADAVALLMSDFGKAVSMEYGIGSSGAAHCRIMGALFEHFGYSSSMQFHFRKLYNKEQWTRLICRELSAGRPIAYSGRRGFGADDGHSFVCDGIDTEGLLHINWGWDGAFNGYFDMDMLNPEEEEGGYYAYRAAMITGICPAEDGGQGELTRRLTLGRVRFAETRGTELMAYVDGVYNFTDETLRLVPYFTFLDNAGNVVERQKAGMQTTGGRKHLLSNEMIAEADLHCGGMPPGRYFVRLENSVDGEHFERFEVGGLPETCGLTVLDDGTYVVDADTLDYCIETESCKLLIPYNYAGQGTVHLRVTFHNSGDIAYEGDFGAVVEPAAADMSKAIRKDAELSRVVATGGSEPYFYAHSSRTFNVGVSMPEKAGKYRLRFTIDGECIPEAEPFYFDVLPLPEKPMILLTSPMTLEYGNELQQSSSVDIYGSAPFRMIPSADGEEWNHWPVYLYALREGAESSEEVCLLEGGEGSGKIQVHGTAPVLSFVPTGMYRLYFKYFDGTDYVKVGGDRDKYSEISVRLLPSETAYPYLTAAPVINRNRPCVQYSLVDVEVPLSSFGDFRGGLACYDDYLDGTSALLDMSDGEKKTVTLKAEVEPGFTCRRIARLVYDVEDRGSYPVAVYPGVDGTAAYTVVSGEDKRLKLEAPAEFSNLGYFDPGDSCVLELKLSSGTSESFSGKIHLWSYMDPPKIEYSKLLIEPLAATPVDVDIPAGSGAVVRIPIVCPVDANPGYYRASVFYEDEDGVRYALNPNGYDYSTYFSVRTSSGIDDASVGGFSVKAVGRALKINCPGDRCKVSVYSAAGMQVANYPDACGAECVLTLPETLSSGVYVVVAESENAGRFVGKILLD